MKDRGSNPQQASGEGDEQWRSTWYSAAVQFYNQELIVIGQRTMAFLIVQSILVAAFVTILINPNLFPYAFPLIAGGISIVGILFCVLHYLAGQLGSQAAFRWRQYMRRIENEHPDATWNWFHRECEGTGLERQLLDKPPLPSTWLISPVIFFLVWLGAIAYIVTVCSTSPDLCKDFPFWALPLWVIVVLSVVTVIALFVVSWTAWWLLRKSRA